MISPAKNLDIVDSLTPEELANSEKYDDFEAFLHSIEDKYQFRLSDCYFMTCETLDIYHYEDGRIVEK